MNIVKICNFLFLLSALYYVYYSDTFHVTALYKSQLR